MTHDQYSDADQALIAELLDSDPSDPRRAELGAKRPELLAELESLERTAAELDRRADSNRDDEIASALQSQPTDFEQRLEAFALKTMGPGSEGTAADQGHSRDAGSASGPRRFAPGWMLLVAAAAAVVFLLNRGGDEDVGTGGETPRDDLMLNESVSGGDVAPSGAVEAWGPFRWTGEATAGTVRRVRVWSAELAFGAPLLESPDLLETTWTPPTTTLEELPDDIRWRVVEIDPVSGEERVVHEAAAQLVD